MDQQIITQTNKKGQIVIPKKYRDKLGISPDRNLRVSLVDNSLVIQPISGLLVSKNISDESYMEVLEKTKGGWGKETPEEIKRGKGRRSLELKQSSERKKKW